MVQKKVQPTAVIYARQSSGQEDVSASVQQQLRNCKQLCASKGLSVLDCFYDNNTSGRTYPAGAEDIAAVDQGFQDWFSQQKSMKKFRSGLGEAIAMFSKIDYLVLDDLTRLYRPSEGSFLETHIGRLLTSNNVKILLVKGGEIDLGQFSDRISTNVLSTVNDNQLRIQKEKSMCAKRALVDSGIFLNPGKVFALRNLPGKQVEVDPEKANVVKYIYDMISRREIYQRIICNCQEKFGALFPTGKFYSSNFYHIAAQPLYCGYMRNSAGLIIKNRQMEGKEIITYKQWKEVQDVMKEGKKSPRHAKIRRLPFSRLIECGSCGSRLVCGVDRNHCYYYCNHGVNIRHNPNCKDSRVAITVANEESARSHYTGLKAAVTPLLLLAQYHMLELSDLRKSDAKKMDQYQVDLDRYQSIEANMLQEVEEGNISFSEMSKLLANTKEKKKKLNLKIVEITENTKSANKAMEDAKRYFCSFEELISSKIDDALYEELLRQTINKIIMYQDKINVITHNYGSFELPRYMAPNRRHFPKFTWKRFGPETDLRKCKYEITYHYKTEKNTTLIVDFKMLKIYKAPECQ